MFFSYIPHAFCLVFFRFSLFFAFFFGGPDAPTHTPALSAPAWPTVDDLRRLFPEADAVRRTKNGRFFLCFPSRAGGPAGGGGVRAHVSFRAAAERHAALKVLNRYCEHICGADIAMRFFISLYLWISRLFI